MNRNVRDEDSAKDVTLKRPGIHDHHPCDTYHWDESQYRPKNVQSSGENVGISSSPPRKKEENGTVFEQMLSKNLIVTVTILIVILGLGVEILFPPLAAEERGFRQFSASLSSLRKTFLNQTEHLWHLSLAAAKPVLLQKLPKRAGVIFLTGSKRSEAVMDCLARKLSESVNDAFDVKIPVFIFDCRIFQDWDAHKVKQELNNNLTKMFENGTRVAVILALESLPGDSLTIINRFCHQVDAPFKKVVLIMTLNKEQEPTSEADKETYKDTEGLREPTVGSDQIDLLLSHFSSSVAYVRDEGNQLNCVAGKG